MEESILDSVKQYLGIESSCNSFDQDLMMHINSTLSTLYHIGVDSARSFIVEDSIISWTELFAGDEDLIPMIKQYVFLKVRILFDPPSSSFVFESVNRTIAELEWRINIEAEGGFEDLPVKETKKRFKYSDYD